MKCFGAPVGAPFKFPQAMSHELPSAGAEDYKFENDKLKIWWCAFRKMWACRLHCMRHIFD